ncbi:hypothetical protein HDU91_004262, partial [Kappamyces sp. JEL0680]
MRRSSLKPNFPNPFATDALDQSAVQAPANAATVRSNLPANENSVNFGNDQVKFVDGTNQNNSEADEDEPETRSANEIPPITVENVDGTQLGVPEAVYGASFMGSREFSMASIGGVSRSQPSIHGKSQQSIGVKSHISRNSASSGGSDKRSKSKEIPDSLIQRIYTLRNVLGSFVIHILYLVVMQKLASPEGLNLPFGSDSIQHAGSIVAEAWMMVSYVVLEKAVDDGMAAYIAYRLCQKEGYSAAGCGFVHAKNLEKLVFPGRLSFGSRVKTFLSRASWVWGVLFALLFLTP